MAGFILAIVAIAVVAGCLGGDNVDEDSTLIITGSTTVLPIAEIAAEEYMKDHDVRIFVNGGGSGVGVEAAGTGTADIGMASRGIKESEMSEYPDLIAIPIAKDGIAIIVHPTNVVSDLTVEQVKRIYLGEITNWDEVGGEDLEIVVVGRDSASGTRGTFDELVLDKEDPSMSMLEKQSNGDVFETVKGNENAIGYVGLGYVTKGVKGLRMEGVEPSVPTVLDGSYPISRNLNLVFKGDPEGPAREFLDFMLSSEGQRIVEEKKFVPLS